MRIAYVLINANRREGTSRAVVEVAERLGSRHEVHVFARENECLRADRTTWRRIAGPAWPDVAEFECYRVATQRRLRRDHFDIIHSAGCNATEADVYAIQTVHPRKMEVNSAEGRDSKVGTLRRFTRQLYDRRVLAAERNAYRPYNSRGLVGFLPVSQGTETELRESYPLDGALIEVIPNGADLQMFHPGLKDLYRGEVRREMSCDETDVVFLFAGGEWRRKGLKLALEAFAKVARPGVILAVAGDDPQRNEFRSFAESLGVMPRIRWLGFRSDIHRIYAAADAFLFPSAYEAFSLATIEAAATGLPVMMADISGARELLGDGRGGAIVERSAAAISAVMIEWVNHPELRQRMGIESRKKVERDFHWDRIADQTERFYERLLRHRANNPCQVETA